MKKWNAESIKAFRKEFNLTQFDLAEELGCRQQTVSEWEVGWRDPGRSYQKLLDVVEKKFRKDPNAEIRSLL